MITFGSLFAGIGGLDLGLERSGMQCKWQVEIDEFCNRVLERHWPNVARYRDVRECGRHNLAAVDLICGGFPCQPHSLAGKRKASADERDLWGEFARIIRELRPRWVVAENVRGLLSSESGRFFGRVLGDLAESGYDAEWQVLPAAAFGAPHRRDRVFIVAYRNERIIEGRTVFNGVLHSPPKTESARWLSDGRRRRVVDGQGNRRVRWIPDERICRVADGVPADVDRLSCLGNAVVPQVAEYIGRLIVESDPC